MPHITDWLNPCNKFLFHRRKFYGWLEAHTHIQQQKTEKDKRNVAGERKKYSEDKERKERGGSIWLSKAKNTKRQTTEDWNQIFIVWITGKTHRPLRRLSMYPNRTAKKVRVHLYNKWCLGPIAFKSAASEPQWSLACCYYKFSVSLLLCNKTVGIFWISFQLFHRFPCSLFLSLRLLFFLLVECFIVIVLARLFCLSMETSWKKFSFHCEIIK